MEGNLIFSEINNVFDYNLSDKKHYVNDDLKSIIIVVKGEIPYTDEELAQLNEYGSILTNKIKSTRGLVLGGNYYFIKKCEINDDIVYQCRRKTWDSSRFYDKIEEFFSKYINVGVL